MGNDCHVTSYYLTGSMIFFKKASHILSKPKILNWIDGLFSISGFAITSPAMVNVCGVLAVLCLIGADWTHFQQPLVMKGEGGESRGEVMNASS